MTTGLLGKPNEYVLRLECTDLPWLRTGPNRFLSRLEEDGVHSVVVLEKF